MIDQIQILLNSKYVNKIIYVPLKIKIKVFLLVFFV
ncbi:MAG: hypothetical protein ACI9BN_000197, partial [Francisella sp.]